MRLGIIVFALLLLGKTAFAAEIMVYKDKNSSCGCCEKWIRYLKENRFIVNEKEIQNLKEFRKEHGITEDLSSCHTALINGYVLEGHVPAEDIKRLLEENPDIKALCVPGVPAGSPGVEQEDGKKENFNVIAIKKDGSTFVYSRHCSK